jgi:mannose-6-phosphate isomerase-like protein (cupin superfamily)
MSKGRCGISIASVLGEPRKRPSILLPRRGEVLLVRRMFRGELRVANESVDFAAEFSRLAAQDGREIAIELGGVILRLVRVAGGGEGRWDRHDSTAETAIVWNGDFSVEFRDRTLFLGPGQCCVIPTGAEHRGTSKNGAQSYC